MHTEKKTGAHILHHVGLYGLFFLVGLFLSTSIASATHDIPKTFHDPIEISGFAWSDNIGWVSFNCDQPGASPAINTCGTVDYSVSLIPDGNPTDSIIATLEGYAWSEHIGWIKFGNLSNFPAGSEGDAYVGSIGSEYHLFGWARACAGTINGDCSDMTDHPDGWDGWISLTCKNTNCTFNVDPTYFIELDNGSMNGYAWGSTVVDWIDFFTSYIPPCSPTNMCTVDHTGTIATDQFCVEQTPVLCNAGFSCVDATGTCSWGVIGGSISVDPTLARKGQTTEVTWDVTLAVGGAVDSCSVEGTNGDVFSGQSGTAETSVLDAELVTYTLYCIPQGGGTPVELESATVKTLPMINET